MAVWEVADALKATGSISKTAEHFSWPPALVRSALAYVKSYPDRIKSDRKAELPE